MGDMNAKVGRDNTGEEEVMGIHGIGQVNDNGERFKGLCGFNQLVIGGTIFPHKTVHKASWVSPDGKTENQIDHFTISKKFRRSLQDVRVMRGADIGSDHHLLIGKVKIKLKRYGNVFCKEGKRMRFQVNLLQDPQKRQEFHLELKNRFELLGTLEDVDVDGQWEKVKEVMKSTCSSVLGEQRKPRSGWITLESLERIGKRREAKQVVNKARTRKEKLEAQRKFSELNKSVKNSIKKDKNVFLEGLAERAEKAAACGQMKIVYDTTRIISGKHRTSITRPVKDKHGNDIYEQEGQLNRWREHFEQLLNRPPPESPPEILPARLDLPNLSTLTHLQRRRLKRQLGR